MIYIGSRQIGNTVPLNVAMKFEHLNELDTNNAFKFKSEHLNVFYSSHRTVGRKFADLNK